MSKRFINSTKKDQDNEVESTQFSFGEDNETLVTKRIKMEDYLDEESITEKDDVDEFFRNNEQLFGKNIEVETIGNQYSAYIIIPKNVLEYKFQPSQLFLGYEMFFLEEAIRYTFKFPVVLKKTKYNYHVQKISKTDVEDVNTIFQKMKDGLKQTSCDAYMNCGDIQVFDASFPRQVMEFQDGLMWFLKIKIQGFKIQSESIIRLSPIWKIEVALLTSLGSLNK